MKIISVDIQVFIQFEMETERDGIIMYRVDKTSMDWERLWDNGWEEVTFDVELKELTQLYNSWTYNLIK